MTRRINTEGPACSYRRTGHNPALGARRLESLTEREREVFLLLGTGLGNRELARELGIAERTVKAHIANIVDKTEQETRTQAAILAALAHDELCSDSACTRRLGKTLEQSRKSTAA
ncbi:response regulator transcription factor [Streptomyces olivochromogenes]|uniref:response regulator transcription factor n=1 Tax=Streptomyces olivochromogenes TaxID=1963 RepID=UPI001F1A0296|nr:LuxR C-terminal-related transcriptional regulator [Streptomyces olivochromogenes]MCF3135568.1 response regulator transcription factor [Streptomyces olivochromogenes]